MRTIYKYPVLAIDEFAVEAHADFAPLCVQVQGGAPFVWAVVDPETPPTKQVFQLRGTGHPLRNVGRYVGTFQQDGGALVFHLFWGTRP